MVVVTQCAAASRRQPRAHDTITSYRTSGSRVSRWNSAVQKRTMCRCHVKAPIMEVPEPQIACSRVAVVCRHLMMKTANPFAELTGVDRGCGSAEV